MWVMLKSALLASNYWSMLDDLELLGIFIMTRLIPSWINLCDEIFKFFINLVQFGFVNEFN